MGKKLLQDCKMSDAAFVDQAAGWADDLTHRESRGNGDVEGAWRRLSTRYGIPWRLFWQLRYRKPKEIRNLSIYVRLYAAYEAERQRQRGLLSDDIDNTEEATGPDHPAVRAAKALVGTAYK